MTESHHSTHEERLKELEKVFAEQSAKAISTNKLRGVATMAKICELARVEKTHVYGHTPCPPNIAKKYKDFLEKVQLFNTSFVARNKAAIENSALAEIQKQDALEENHELKKDITGLEARVKLLEKKNHELVAKKTYSQIYDEDKKQDESVVVLPDVSINIICPDDHLEVDGRYNFNDKKQREIAWVKAHGEFAQFMKRKIPQRVYLLMGPPCAGKSEWANRKPIRPDRHAVIIDATNLTSGDRAKWIMQSQKASDVKICVVRLVTDEMTLRSRNVKRHHKMLDVDVLNEKIESIEEVNPNFEEVDEMLFVRSEDA